MGKKELIRFSFVFLVFALIGFLIINDESSLVIYDLTFSSAYIFLIFLFFIIFVLVILFKKELGISEFKEKVLKWVSYIVFAPLVFFPIFKCYFKVPYIFCHVCPRKCAFGHLRAFVVPFILLVNFDKRFWCFKHCPIGRLQEGGKKVVKKRIVLPKVFSYLRYLVLVALVVGYFKILKDVTAGPLYGLDLFVNAFKNVFSFSLVVFLVALVFLVISLFIYRFFCDYFCPIGTVSDGMLKVQKKVEKKRVDK